MTSVVLGVIGSDAHVVGITLLDHALEEAGYSVTNIGVQSSQQEFIEAAVSVDADAILVSSLYGHAEQDCEGFHAKLAEADIDPLTYIGGNLSVGTGTDTEVFRQMGFDSIYSQESDIEEIIKDLKNDLRSDEQSKVSQTRS
jgi:methylaspartate mutase sigma subunit